MLLPGNFQGKAARFALLASVGGHGGRKLAVVPVQRKAAKFTKPGNLGTFRPARKTKYRKSQAG